MTNTREATNFIEGKFTVRGTKTGTHEPKVANMKITEIKIYPVEDGGRLKAYATMVFDDCFIVRDLKVIEGDKGFFVSMPSRKRKDGSFRDIVHPLNSTTRTDVEKTIIEEYTKSLVVT